MDLSYDWGYNVNSFNGNISGVRWSTASAGAECSLGFGYDNSNRLLLSDFKENNSGIWNNSSGIEFSTKMGNGADYSTAYYNNGNILQMQQWGLKQPGVSSLIDNLVYTYTLNNSSNKLRQ